MNGEGGRKHGGKGVAGLNLCILAWIERIHESTLFLSFLKGVRRRGEKAFREPGGEGGSQKKMGGGIGKRRLGRSRDDAYID